MKPSVKKVPPNLAESVVLVGRAVHVRAVGIELEADVEQHSGAQDSGIYSTGTGEGEVQRWLHLQHRHR